MASITQNKDKIGQSLMGATGQFLIATSSMADPRFERCVIYMLSHDEQGAQGIVINKIFEEVEFIDLMEQLEIQFTEDLTRYKVLIGGPVEIGRGVVVHSTDVMLPESTKDGDLAVTNSMDMLEKIAKGQGPKESLFALGYARWSAGQLDAELKENTWLCVPASKEILFNTPVLKRWERALETSGIQVAQLSGTAGRA